MKQISSNVYQLGLGIVNAFVAEDAGGLTLIDTGTAGSAAKICAMLRKAGKDPQSIRRIILTHCHSDHAGGAAEFKELINVPVFAHSEDAQLIEAGIAIRPHNELTPGMVNWLVYHAFIKRAAKTIKPVHIDEQLKDGDTLPVAGGIQVIHTPGHTAGHISLLLKNEGVLIAADMCANSGGLALSTLYEDRAQGIRSIIKAAAYDFNIALFGHGSALQANANERIKNLFFI